MVTLKRKGSRSGGQSLQHTQKSPQKRSPYRVQKYKEQARVTERWRKKKICWCLWGVGVTLNIFHLSQLGATSWPLPPLGPHQSHCIQRLQLSGSGSHCNFCPRRATTQSSGMLRPLPNPSSTIMVMLRQLEQKNESKMVARRTTHWVNKRKRL